jgi:pyruvate decarboxylase
VKGISAVFTTFGVGELSLINAIAGAFSEFVPIVHIVGYPSTVSQRNGAILHHTLGNGDFTIFKHVSQQISVATAMLNNIFEVPALIDHAIAECYLKSRPVYIALPSDVVTKKVEGARLKTKLNLEFPPNDEEKENYVVDVVLKYLREARNPIILVDACAIRHRVCHKRAEKND